MNQLKIVVETLLPGKGSQIELSVELSDKISMIKWNIQKTLGETYNVCREEKYAIIPLSLVIYVLTNFS